MIRAHVHRVPFRCIVGAPRDHVDDQATRRIGRKDVGTTGEIFLDDVILRSSAKFLRGDTLLFGIGHIQRQQPRSSCVDGHRRVHRPRWNGIEQSAHVAEVSYRNAHLADLSTSEEMVRVVPSLGREVERNRQAGLTFCQVGAVQLIGCFRGGVTGVRPHEPRISMTRCRHAQSMPASPAVWRGCGSDVWVDGVSAVGRWRRRDVPSTRAAALQRPPGNADGR